jgi:hypothetical protein
MADLFESELKDRAEIQRLNEVVKSLLSAGGRVASELQSLVDDAIMDNSDKNALSEAQGYLAEWDKLVIEVDGDWLSKIVNSSHSTNTINLGDKL